jgi:hypothetical protein
MSQLYTGHRADSPEYRIKWDERCKKNKVVYDRFMEHREDCETCTKNPLEPCSQGTLILKERVGYKGRYDI